MRYILGVSMALALLGPLAHSVSGRIGRLVFCHTRWGTVLRAMRPNRTTRTDREKLVNARFAVARKTWSIMDYPIQQTLFALHRRRNAGTPGPWIGSLLHYDDGGPYHYPYATHPLMSPKIVSITFNDPLWTVLLDREPTLPFVNVLICEFHPSDITTVVPYWRLRPWSSNSFTFTLRTSVTGHSLIVLPVVDSVTSITGVPDCRPMPYP